VRIQIITNLDNGAGLQQDYALLADLCREAGHEVLTAHIHRPSEAVRADLNVFLEVLVPSLLDMAPRNWLVPNSEWWGGHWNVHLGRIERVLCKTQDCLRIWKKKHKQCVFTGWAARDLWKDIPKEAKFLHTAGKSQTKNTTAVAEAWRRFHLPYPLTVVAFKPEIARSCKGIDNVHLVNRFTETELQDQINSARFFIMPSKYEGYGHSIHEALGCRAVVITTNGEPMRSFSGIPRALLVQTVQESGMAEATASLVSISALANTVRKAVALPLETLDRLGNEARAGFLKDNAYFFQTIRGVLNGL
jgi:hypothetical protein